MLNNGEKLSTYQVRNKKLCCLQLKDARMPEEKNFTLELLNCSILTVTFGQASKALFALLRHVDFIRKKSFSVSFYLGKEERFDTCSE